MSDSTIAARERQVERNREQLADTVDALHAKLDMRTRAQAKLREVGTRAQANMQVARTRAQANLQEVRGRATTDTGKPRTDLVVAAAAVVVGLGAVVWWRKH